MKTPAPERAAGRRKLAAQGDALKGGTDPIPDLAYLKKAIRSKGRVDSSKWPALKVLIRKRAKELGALNAPGVKGTWAFEMANGGGAIDFAGGPQPYRRGPDENVQCPSCKKYNSADARYCDQCGVKLPASAYEMSNTEGSVIEMAATRTMNRVPRVRGTADVTLHRTGAGAVSVQHKATGTRMGMLNKASGGWTATHATGKTMDPAPTMAASLSGLIGAHNKIAASAPSMAGATSYAGDQEALDFAAASTPAVTSGDGPRVTSMGGAGKAVKSAKAKMSAKAKASPAPAGAMSAEVAKVYRKLIKKGLSPAQAMGLAKRAASMHAKAGAKKAA